MKQTNTKVVSQFDDQAGQVEKNIEGAVSEGVISAKDARDVIQQGGLQYAQELGVDDEHAKAIIDRVLKIFDQFVASNPTAQDSDQSDDDLGDEALENELEQLGA